MTPIYRQSIRNILDKLQISSNTNRNWLTHGAELLTPIVRLLKKKLLKVKSILNIDETWTKGRIKFKVCKDADADTFVQLIATLYRVEAECLLNHYTPQQIKKRRQQRDVTKILSLIGPLEKVCGYRSTIKILFCPFIKLNNG